MIGAGSVGTALAFLLQRSGSTIDAVISRSKRSAQRCGKIVGCRLCSDTIADIPTSSDLVVVAVPDRALPSVAESIARLKNLDFRHLAVCHTSGFVTSDVLSPIAVRGAKVFSFHPIQTFPKEKPLKEQVTSMKRISYGIEGSDRSLNIARQLSHMLDGKYLVVPKEAKILYHCACVFASNYSVALLGAIEAIAKECRWKDLQPFKRLIETSIENGLGSGAAESLTGPIVRGDVETVKQHLLALPNDELRGLYKALGIMSLGLAEKSGGLAPGQSSGIREALR